MGKVFKFFMKILHFFLICKQIQVNDFSEITKIFSTLAQNFLKIFLVNPNNFSAKHVNLQLAQTPVADERCCLYTQSASINPHSLFKSKNIIEHSSSRSLKLSMTMNTKGHYQISTTLNQSELQFKRSANLRKSID